MTLENILKISFAILGLLHLCFGLFEMAGSTKQQSKAFEINDQFISQPEAIVLLRNQGVYNIMLGLTMMISSALLIESTLRIVALLLSVFVIVVGIFGSVTSSKKIFYTQALPGFIVFLIAFTSFLFD